MNATTGVRFPDDENEKALRSMICTHPYLPWMYVGVETCRAHYYMCRKLDGELATFYHVIGS